MAALRLAERIVFGCALIAASDDTLRGLVIGLGSGLLLAARGFLVMHLRLAARLRVETRSASAVLAADPLAPVLGGGDDPFVAFHEGSEQLVRLIVDLVPGAWGDGIASLLLSAWLVRTLPHADLLLLGCAAAAGGLIAFAVRSAVTRNGRGAWRAQMPVWVQLRTIVAAREELLANARDGAATRELATRLRRWASLEIRYQTLAGVSGRLPFVAAAGLVLVGILARTRSGWSSDLWRQCLFFGAVAAPLAGVLTAVHELTKVGPMIGSLVTLMAAARDDRRPPVSAAPVATPRELVARGIGHRYGGAMADSLPSTSFRWAAGRLLAITGANGAGKSTLLKLLLRLAEPSSGQLELDGRTAASIDATAWRSNFAYVSQVPYFDEDATVRDFFEILVPDAGDVRVRAALERVGLWSRLQEATEPLDVRIRSLSAGQRQRAVLARALAQDKPMLLLDEPDASLDAEGVELLVALLREVATQRMVAVVAHSAQLIAAAHDRLEL